MSAVIVIDGTTLDLAGGTVSDTIYKMRGDRPRLTNGFLDTSSRVVIEGANSPKIDKIRIDLAYEEPTDAITILSTPLLDANGDPVLDANGDPVPKLAYHTRIDDVDIRGGQYGVRAIAAGDVWITGGCLFKRQKNAVLVGGSVSNLHVTGCAMEASFTPTDAYSAAAVVSTEGAQAVSVQGCRIEGWGRGMDGDIDSIANFEGGNYFGDKRGSGVHISRGHIYSGNIGPA